METKIFTMVFDDTLICKIRVSLKHDICNRHRGSTTQMFSRDKSTQKYDGLKNEKKCSQHNDGPFYCSDKTWIWLDWASRAQDLNKKKHVKTLSGWTVFGIRTTRFALREGLVYQILRSWHSGWWSPGTSQCGVSKSKVFANAWFVYGGE